MHDPLFQPIEINAMAVANRIVMPAMHLNMGADFEVTDRMVDFYRERARGGAGMITVGFATVDELSGMPLNIGAHHDRFIPGLARLAAAIREEGSRAAVQLNHMGRYNFSFFTGTEKPVAPSAIASRLTKETPRALLADEIGEIVAKFASAALRVKSAGFDAVEVLCGTGYLVSQFLSPLTNARGDEYGGSLENRMRFGLDVLRAVRAAVGHAFPLVVRMNGNDFMPGGIGRRDLVAFARAVVAAGADAICVNVGWHEAQVPQIVPEVPRGVFGYLARGIKESVGVPVIASHRINYPETARGMLSDGTCDMVALGRALIADPMLPRKAREGKEGSIVHCVGCGQGCFDHIFELKAIECLCNPVAGYERERACAPAAKPLKVMVVGGGAAGMSAATAAADRGHAVVLHERDDRLGGQLLLAGAPPGREEFAHLAGDLARQVAARGVTVVLNSAVDELLLSRERPDVLVLATGARPAPLPLPGAELPHVAQAWDVLAGKAHTGRRVVIVGGGSVGIETAILLAHKGTLSAEAARFLLVHRAESFEDLWELCVRGSKEVTIVEMTEKAGRDLGRTTRWGMLQELERSGVALRLSTKALAITPEAVRVVTGEREELLPADSVALAAGAVPFNPLAAAAKRLGIAVRVAGDAAQIGKAIDAIHAGFLAGAGV